MSKYVSAMAVMRANCAAQACALLGVASDGVAALAEARELLAYAQADLPALSQWVQNLTTAADDTLRALRPGALIDVERVLAEAGQHAAIDAATLLHQAFTDADAMLAGAARDTLVTMTTEFAQRIEARVTVERGEAVTAVDIRLRDDNGDEQVMLVQVGEDGVVDRDYIGMVGNTCQTLDVQYTNYLRAAGAELVSLSEDRHGGRRDGVRLIRQAAARDTDNLARGAVLNAEQPQRATHTDAGAHRSAAARALWTSTPLHQRITRNSATANSAAPHSAGAV